MNKKVKLIVFGIIAILLLAVFYNKITENKSLSTEKLLEKIDQNSQDKEPLTEEKEQPENVKQYLSVKEGLPNAKLFFNMKEDITYYAKVRKNPLEYTKLVDDDRIYDLEEAKLLY